MSKTIFFDLDGTVAEWRVAATFEDLLKPGYFYTLNPTEIALFANQMKKVVKNCYVLSAYMPETNALKEKQMWCEKYLPEFDAMHQLYVPCGIDKARFVMEALKRPLTKEDILIDDYSINLIEWENANGFGIKWLNGINGNNNTFNGIRTNSLKGLEKILLS